MTGPGRERTPGETPAAPAFTLIELLVVIAILGVLVGLLAPALGSASQAVDLVRCTTNLGRLYQAENTWRADRQQVLFTRGTGWFRQLMPYLDGDDRVGLCPSATLREGNETNEGVFHYVEGSGTFAVDVYNGSLTQYSWTITMDSPWMRLTQVSGEEWKWAVEDQGIRGGGDKDFNDVRGTVWFFEGVPYRIRIDDKESACNFKLIVNGEVAVDNCAASLGKTVEITERGTGQAGYYGLSTGTYDVPLRDVPTVDPRLFLLIDYPKPLADYNTEGDDDDWGKFFITSPEGWERRYGGKANVGSWQQHQALRHGGQANVLFCDGHVELLGPDDLNERDFRWRFGAP